MIDRDLPSATASEGQTAVNTGTFFDPEGGGAVVLTSSVGIVTDTGGGTWAWSFATSDGPSQGQTVMITATDDKGESASVTFPLVVDNVAPSVAVDAQQVTTISEGDFLSASGTFSDPGWADTYSSTFDWGTPTGDTGAGTTNVTSEGPPGDQGTSTGSFQYGDDGTFDVEVGVTDDDGGTGTDSFAVAVENVAPTATIDLSDAVVDVNGTPTILGTIGVPVHFSARSTDPGSDDLTVAWDWRRDDAGPDVTAEYLVNSPTPDAPNLVDPSYSPAVQPRDVTDSRSNKFRDACRYTVTFHAADDDGGAATDQVKVLIRRGALRASGPGYWQNQVNAPNDFTHAELGCLLRAVISMSPVLAQRDVSTREKALEVIKADASTMSAMLDRFLITSWLNFGNGPFDLDDRVDTDRDGTPDTTFGAALARAEAVRLDPASTRAQLEAQKNILERINGK